LYDADVLRGILDEKSLRSVTRLSTRFCG